MIVAVKRNKNLKAIKIVIFSIFMAILLFFIYSNYKINQEEIKLANEEQEVIKIEANKKDQDKLDIEKAILSEVEKAVELVGQEHIRTIKIIDNKIVIVCEPNSNLEALFVRYGAMAMIKKTLNETVIAVDINFILKSRLYEK
ncbi:hypothetical protein AFAEC_1983 [Aliarcobacter faecis]|uniref:hypothetical protein n=1 Tax=Aliarcobacter faecis TaxID=1564138 RepID=UPI00047C502B|nr:hypothetical protein [Aliarcobacter faecis]QKF74134.1 hypothetical protein AFAEC_1983 [Aliarcobacter faecis]